MKIALLMVLALAVGLIGAVILWPQPALVLGLAIAGVDVEIEDARVGLDGIEIDGVGLGGEHDDRLAGLRIRYRPLDLLRGRLEAIELEGLRLRTGVPRSAAARGVARGGGERAWLVPGLLGHVERVTLRDAALRLDTRWAEIGVSFEAGLDIEDGGAFILRVDRARVTAAGGSLEADLELRGRVPLVRPVGLEAAEAKGTLRWAARGLALGDAGADVDTAAQVDLSLSEGRLALSSDDLTVAVGSLRPGLAWLGRLAPAPWRLASSGAPLRVLAEATDDGFLLAAEGRLEATTAGPRAAVTLSGALDVDRTGGIRRVARSALDLSLAGLAWRDLHLAEGRLAMVAEGRPDDLRVDLDLALTARGEAIAGLEVGEADLRHRLRGRLGGGRLELRATGPGRLLLRDVTWQETWRASRVVLGLPESEQPLLVAGVDGAGMRGWRLGLRAEMDPTEVVRLGSDAPLQVRIDGTVVRLGAEGDGAAPGDGTIALASRRVQVEPLGIRLDDATIEWSSRSDRAEDGAPIALAARRIGSTVEPAWLAPMALSGRVVPLGEAVLFELVGHGDAGLEVVLEGRHDRAAAGGSASLVAGPLDFVPGGVQPQDVSPWVGRTIDDVAGRLALGGGLGWTREAGLTVDLALRIEDLSFSAGPARVAAVNGRVRVDRLLPLSTPPGQRLDVGVVDLGLRLTDGLLEFGLRPDGTVAVQRLLWPFAGGTMRAEPFDLGPGGSPIAVRLVADHLDLAALLAETRLPGLSGEGIVEGVLPLQVGADQTTISGGRLTTRGTGWLRYRREARPDQDQDAGQGVALLLAVLENFRYDQLQIELDGRADGEMAIGLLVRGANPDLYGGHPIQLDVALKGDLASIFRPGPSDDGLPDQIRRRIDQLGR